MGQQFNFSNHANNAAICSMINNSAKYMSHHNMSKTPTYAAWSCLKSRCDRKKDKAYKNYGGRGITYCNEWNVFKNFFSDMGERPEGCSIERINNNGNYEISNCKWIPMFDQASNTRKSLRLFKNGERINILQECKKIGVYPRTVYSRWDRGMRDYDSLFYLTPLTRRTAYLIAPDGIEYYVLGNQIKPFCRTHGLTSSGISRLLNGQYKKSQGWTGHYMEIK